MATKALTKKLIKDLGRELAATALLSVAYANVGIPKSTFYHWRTLAETLDSENPDREGLTANDELLLDFLDTIQFSRAKAAKVLIDSAFRHAKNDGNVAIKLLERIMGDEFAPPARREIVSVQSDVADSGTGIALIPSMSGDNDLDQLLQQQQSAALLLAKTKTRELS